MHGIFNHNMDIIIGSNLSYPTSLLVLIIIMVNAVTGL